MNPNLNLVLLGFMGTGKSAVGRILARRLGRPFVEMDAEIERRAGRGIPEIFASEGEAAFRAMERAWVREQADRPGRVIATGGGVVLDPANLEDLGRHGVLVCLTASFETLRTRLGGDRSRPLLEGGRADRLAELLESRRPLYEAIRLRVDTTGRTPDEVADEVLRRISGRGGEPGALRTCLNAGMIGWEAPPGPVLEAAVEYGFQAVDLTIPAETDGSALRDALARMGLEPGCAFGLIPFRFLVPDAEWERTVAELPSRLKTAAVAGFRRLPAVVLPFHASLEYPDCLRLHVERLRRIRPMLADHGIRLGLEYVSPLSRRAGQPHPFLHTLAGLLRLLEELDDPVFGVLLDSFHWYCARETAGDLAALRGRIVAVHVNDAPAGRRREDQLALERELPDVTGVIPMGEFLRGLRAAEFEGPVAAEPMNAALNALPLPRKLALVRDSLDRCLAPPQAG
jgi:shikimate kinase/hydroxypyruvate isomerase